VVSTRSRGRLPSPIRHVPPDLRITENQYWPDTQQSKTASAFLKSQHDVMMNIRNIEKERGIKFQKCKCVCVCTRAARQKYSPLVFYLLLVAPCITPRGRLVVRFALYICQPSYARVVLSRRAELAGPTVSARAVCAVCSVQCAPPTGGRACGPCGREQHHLPLPPACHLLLRY
jgi:hypothetical protein